MPQYIVLFPISPEVGPLILPAQADRNAPDVVPEPVIVDESVISDEAAPILIAAGVIALLPGSGGPIVAGEPYLVGDDGPELFVPSAPPPRRRKP